MLSASIRGIGQDDFAFNLDPGVGVYLDGVFLARTIGANQNLLDVDRVEILKGPQGTLFGRNTIGGAINIVTHEPGTEARFQAQATGGSFDRRDFAFTADLPITDKVLSSITASSLAARWLPGSDSVSAGTPWATHPSSSIRRNAYPKAGYDRPSSYGGQNQQVIRGKIVWHRVGRVQLTLTGDYQHQDQSSTAVDGAERCRRSNPAVNIFGLTLQHLHQQPRVGAGRPGEWAAVVHRPHFDEHDHGRVRPARNGSPELGGTGGPPLGGAGYVSEPGRQPGLCRRHAAHLSGTLRTRRPATSTRRIRTA